MKTKLLATVGAAALALSFAAASAQTTMEKGGGAPAGTMEKGGAPAASERGPAADQRAPGAQRGTMEKSKTAPGDQQAQTPGKQDNRAAEGKTGDRMEKDKAAQGAEPKGSDNRMSSENNKPSDSKMGDKAAERGGPNAARTVGAAPSGEARMTTEQRTQIREKVLATGPRVNSVNFALNVGTVVPHDVRFADVPPVIIDIHPEWRGYRYFIVNDQIVIVEPGSLRIIAVLDV